MALGLFAMSILQSEQKGCGLPAVKIHALLRAALASESAPPISLHFESRAPRPPRLAALCARSALRARFRAAPAATRPSILPSKKALSSSPATVVYDFNASREVWVQVECRGEDTKRMMQSIDMA